MASWQVVRVDRLPERGFLGNLPNGVSLQQKHGVFAASVLVFVALLACKSGSKAKCVSAVELDWQSYSSLGTASSKAKARESSVVGACIAYCQFGDGTVKAAYDRWKRANPGSPATPEAITTIHLKREVDACKVRCALAVKGGKAKVKTECL